MPDSNRKSAAETAFSPFGATASEVAIPSVASPDEPVATAGQSADDDSQTMANLQRENEHIRRLLDRQQKLATLGKLTAAMAHEINNPTDFVNGSSRNLQRDLREFEQFLYDLAGDDADAEIIEELQSRISPLHEHIKLIIDGAERIRAIVRDIRSVSHTTGAEFIEVEITRWLTSTVNLVRPSYDSTVVISTEFRDLLSMECLPNRLSQVFMNIIINACNAIVDRFGNDAHGAGRLDIAAWRVDEQGFISIRDNGGGIPDPIRTRIFDPYFSTRKSGKGTGLGLAISRDIIRHHGGEIRLESEMGQGTCFTLILPMKQNRAQRDSRATEPGE